MSDSLTKEEKKAEEKKAEEKKAARKKRAAVRKARRISKNLDNPPLHALNAEARKSYTSRIEDE